jgi:superfamily II DNA/RNA helicase
MMRYDIEETAVYDKYVRWCGRTGPRGPSYPIPRPRLVLLCYKLFDLRRLAKAAVS